jgi:hypothetical protein
MSKQNEKTTEKSVKLTYNSPKVFEMGSIEKIQTGRDGNNRDASSGYYYG